MIDKAPITSIIFKNYSFSKEEQKLIESNFQRKKCKKGDFLLNAGEVALEQYYVLTGCLRVFFRDNLGKEHTLQFAIHDWWICDYTAYFSESKATMTIECITDAKLFRIRKKDLDKLYKEVPVLETFFREKLQNAYASFQTRILRSFSKTTKERYLEFINSYPEIEGMVKNYHIASYLGVTTETISRVRKNIEK